MRSYSKKHFKRSKIIRRLINCVQSFRQATSLAPNAWSAMLIRSVLRPGSQRFILDVFLAFVNHSRYNSLEGRPQGQLPTLNELDMPYDA